jgi:hypothetical protein
MKYRISIPILLCFAVWAAPVDHAIAMAPIVTVSPASPTTSVGRTFLVAVDITGVSDLYGFQLDLGFNPSILAAQSSTEGAFLPGGGATFFIPGTIDNTTGTVGKTADTLLSAVPGVNGNGLLFTIDFKALSAGTSSLVLENATFLNSRLNPIVLNLTGGSVRVQGTTVPEPGTLGLLGLGLVVAGVMRCCRAPDPPLNP